MKLFYKYFKACNEYLFEETGAEAACCESFVFSSSILYNLLWYSI